MPERTRKNVGPPSLSNRSQAENRAAFWGGRPGAQAGSAPRLSVFSAGAAGIPGRRKRIRAGRPASAIPPAVPAHAHGEISALVHAQLHLRAFSGTAGIFKDHLLTACGRGIPALFGSEQRHAHACARIALMSHGRKQRFLTIIHVAARLSSDLTVSGHLSICVLRQYRAKRGMRRQNAACGGL